MTDILFNAVGFLGAIIVLVAYFMLEKGRLKSYDFAYPVLNGIGSLLIIISLMNNWNLASFLVNSAWVVISIYGIIRIRKKS